MSYAWNEDFLPVCQCIILGHSKGELRRDDAENTGLLEGHTLLSVVASCPRFLTGVSRASVFYEMVSMCPCLEIMLKK